MVHPKYRNNGAAIGLLNTQIGYARNNNYDILVAYTHPDNIWMNKALISAGMKKEKTIITGEKYLRNVYQLELKDYLLP